MFTEDQLLPLSALQHWLYCQRQCALIHLEQAWAENRFTAEGRILHEKAHEGRDESRAGIRITRGMAVRSLDFGLSGQCDVVEFRSPSSGGSTGDLRFEISDLKPEQGNLKSRISDPKSDRRIVPVEYKRGKPKAHRADEVQLCAQAICLEEMLGVAIASGDLYYGERRRRAEVVFDETLRTLVRETAEALHEMRRSAMTPTADYDPKRCDACSLIDLCQPKALRFRRGSQAWFERHLKSQI